MPKSHGVAVAMCLLLGTSGNAFAASPHARIQARMDAMMAAANVHDTDGFLKPFVHGPQLVFVVNGRVIRGYAALRAQQLKWWHKGASGARYTQSGPTSFDDLAPGVVVTTQQLSSRRSGADGKLQRGTFTVTSLWKRRHGEWRIVYAHESWSR